MKTNLITSRENRLFLVLAVVLVAAGMKFQWDAFTFWTHSPWVFSDLAVYREAGNFILTGQPLYQGQPFVTGGGNYDYSYPPFGAVVMVPLTLMSAPIMDALWLLASLLALAGIVSVSFHSFLRGLASRRTRIAAVSALAFASIGLAPVSENLGLGQLGIFLTAAVLYDVARLSPRRRSYAGILTGVATAIKLTPAVFIAYWLITRQWKTAFTAMLTTLTCWMIAGILAWENTRDYFLEGRFARLTSTIGDFSTTEWNQSLYGVLARTVPDAMWLWFPLATAMMGLALFFAYRAWTQDGNALLAASFIGVAGIVVSPISWIHHAIWVIPALGALVGTGRRPGRVLIALAVTAMLIAPTRPTWPFLIPNIWFAGYLLLLLALLLIRENTSSSLLSDEEDGCQKDSVTT